MGVGLFDLPCCLLPISYCLLPVARCYLVPWRSGEEGGNLFFAEAGEGAELFDGDVGAPGFVEGFAELGEAAAGRSVAATGNGHYIQDMSWLLGY